MQKAKERSKLHCIGDSLFLIHAAFSPDLFLQSHAFHIFHNKIYIIIFIKNICQKRNAFSTNFTECPDLSSCGFPFLID